jgi:hypothetical protein
MLRGADPGKDGKQNDGHSDVNNMHHEQHAYKAGRPWLNKMTH